MMFNPTIAATKLRDDARKIREAATALPDNNAGMMAKYTEDRFAWMLEKVATALEDATTDE